MIVQTQIRTSNSNLQVEQDFKMIIGFKLFSRYIKKNFAYFEPKVLKVSFDVTRK
jgi:hypothetical protein